MCDAPINHRLKQPIWSEIHHCFIYSVPINCGKCYPCLQRRQAEWIFRLNQELKECNTAYFVTLTYRTEEVPRTKKGFMTLDREDVKKFMKRLRYYAEQPGIRYEHLIRRKYQIKDEEQKPIKYYAVGEYGSLRKRPHYHLIVLNSHESDIYKAWTKGDVHIGNVTNASLAYVLKYMEKKESKTFPSYWDGVKEFSQCSKGLGQNYLTNTQIKYHRKDYNTNYLTTRDGYRVAMPKFYRNQIWTEEERRVLITHVKNEVDKKAQEYRDMMIRNNLKPEFFLNSAKKARFSKLSSFIIRSRLID